MDNVSKLPNIKLIEEEACDWIVKFEGDNPPDQNDIIQLREWMAQSQTHKDTLLRLASTWNDMDILESLGVPQVDSSLSLIQRVKTLAEHTICKGFYLLRILSRLSREFAFASIILGLTLFIIYSNVNPYSVPEIYLTKVGEHSEQTLTDGTVLSLNTNSKAEVMYTQDKRIINLVKGEAHFKVAKDAQRPFEVYVHNKVVQAIGTAFSVNRMENSVEVLVTEGKVILFAQVLGSLTKDILTQADAPIDETEENQTKVVTTLLAGQRATLDTLADNSAINIEHLQKDEQARKLSWQEGKLIFAGESLEEVVRQVSRHTALVIKVNDPELQNLRVGGQFQLGETGALFDVLESAFNIEVVHINENTVQLNAK